MLISNNESKAIPMPTSPLLAPPAPARRHDLDAIRVAAFGLLILYHIGMFYVSWDFHVKSPRLYPALEPAMLAVNPWRLTLLFLVSGVATRFLFDRIRRGGGGPGTLARERIGRLLPPLLFATFILVPPQSYYQVLEAMPRIAWSASDPDKRLVLDHFWIRYATGTGGWCDIHGACLFTPIYNHMWFVAYLLFYSIMLAALLACPTIATRIDAFVWTPARARWLAAATLVYLAVIRIGLAPAYPLRNTFVNDWYNHALSGAAFLTGVLIAHSDAVRELAKRHRNRILVIAILCWAGQRMLSGGNLAHAGWTSARLMAEPILYAGQQWAGIAAVLGLAARWLNRDSTLLRYLCGGVFCFYIVHQTLIIVLAHHLAHLALPIALEATLLIAGTILGCLLSYEVARRIPVLAIVLGVTKRARLSTAP
jgi:hypothetical protein